MRISRYNMLMEMAMVAAKRGTCSRAQVGSLLARDGRVISTGYNGVPANMKACVHTCTCPSEAIHLIECPESRPCSLAVHAEVNTIAYAARHGVATDAAIMFTTMAPCFPCSQVIINAGVSTVVYLQAYRNASGLDLLKAAGVITWNHGPHFGKNE